MQIRAKESGDITACLQLLAEVHRTDGYPRYMPADPAGFVTPSYEITAWVAEDDGQIVGHVALDEASIDPTLHGAQRATGLPPNQLAVVARLLVDPARRRSGLGRQLLATATGWSRVEPLALALDDGKALELWAYLAPTEGSSDPSPSGA